MSRNKPFMLWREGTSATTKVASNANIFDALALLVTLIVIALDLWTKSLVVALLSPVNSGKSISLLAPYLVLEYKRNSGAAFSTLQNPFVLVILTVFALLVVGYIYFRILNNSPLYYKIVFGTIMGGTLGNVIDRIHNGGYVIDFIFFRIPQLHFKFAIFNVADACITIGAILLFILIFFVRHSHPKKHLMHWTLDEATD